MLMNRVPSVVRGREDRSPVLAPSAFDPCPDPILFIRPPAHVSIGPSYRHTLSQPQQRPVWTGLANGQALYL